MLVEVVVESETVTVTTDVMTLEEVPAIIVVTTVSVTTAPVVANRTAVVTPAFDVPLYVRALVALAVMEADTLALSTTVTT